jgi:hypothetical protein
LKRGLLWLSGNDYAECPDCGGESGGHPGTFVMYEQIIVPGKSLPVSGFKHSRDERVAVPDKIKE